MYFIVLGVLLLAMKVAEFGPVANWSWWIVLAPFGFAVIWWWWADSTGYTKRREMDKMQDRKDARRRKSLEALGIDPRLKLKQDRKTERFRRSRAFQVSKIEDARAEIRKKQHDIVVHGSRFDSSMDTSLPGDDEPDLKHPKSKR
ncbi:MAG: TIGR04438 family Trp-rich protein [Betaproteobacteria bacterium]|nr:MAG: TIGR04438 family Trp-rich protein [Betaproteobacteria bacterium]TMH32504.1 MAG: TIGR04438 family Trp-rich protein [Betaproteobacteria bacterium]